MEQNLLILGAGQYKVIINGATGNSTASSVTISVGDKKLQKEIPSQGDWETYSEVDAGELELIAGKQTLRLTIDNDYINVDWIKFTDVAASISSSATAPASSGSNAESAGSSAADPTSSSSETASIAQNLAFSAGASIVRCQIFDMNGQLIKSTNVKAASVGEAWKSVKSGLQNGMYIMRYGVESRNGKASEMRTVQVRKQP